MKMKLLSAFIAALAGVVLLATYASAEQSETDPLSENESAGVFSVIKEDADGGEPITTSVALKVGSKYMGIGWRVSQIDTDNGNIVPVEKDGTVYVPFKAVIEAFGGNVTDDTAVLGKTEIKLNEAAEEDGVLMAPLSVFEDAFGLFAKYYPNAPYAEGVVVISNEDLSEKKGTAGAINALGVKEDSAGESDEINPVTIHAVAQLLARVNETREYISMEVPKAIFDLADPGTDKGRSPGDLLALSPEYLMKNMDLYPLPDEAVVKDGVPRGTITKFHLDDSAVYPGVQHDFWSYVPAQYEKDGSTPANLIVFTDAEWHMSGENGATDVPAILDNLIHEGRIPVTVAVFISPGAVGDGYPAWGGNDNRSVEYDSVDERFSKFVVNEVMPLALDGIVLSDQIRNRAIVGYSSGGPAALGVAWYTDEFGTVLTGGGSFAWMRMAGLWQFALRNQEKKDLKIFVCSGEYEHPNITWGSWPTVNRAIAESLEYSGYDYIFAMGKSGHNMMWFDYMLPDMLDWAWNGAEFSHDNVEVIMGQ